MDTDEFNAWINPAMNQHPIQGGVEILPVTSCHRKWRQSPDGPPCSYAGAMIKFKPLELTLGKTLQTEHLPLPMRTWVDFQPFWESGPRSVGQGTRGHKTAGNRVFMTTQTRSFNWEIPLQECDKQYCLHIGECSSLLSGMESWHLEQIIWVCARLFIVTRSAI